MARSRENGKGCSICEGRKTAGTTEVYVINDGPDRHFFDVASGHC
ncbi:MAG TPA: hypothetical protein VNW97_09210 [Candidatus Saccharimonadales bacterium]|nr:hypothetical protein [Candidatus Saccharimonadales bacterium]